MRETRLIMGMPVTIDVVDAPGTDCLDTAFAYFEATDRRFSTYRDVSEISAINQARLGEADYSDEMHEVLDLAERTRRETLGYFDIRRRDGTLDPSGIVKGWAIRNAARLVAAAGARDFFVDAGGDIQPSGRNAEGQEWRVGIRSPFDPAEIIKVVYPRGHGVATSGTYARGGHIYDPHDPGHEDVDIVGLTVIGPDILEADRFATAAFAMGRPGIGFIEERPELEGYMVDAGGRATFTSGFEDYCAP
ncbi:MAG: FAD:protein FMN transferase [Bauldia sp.]|uniref:FAD:protein FMN transferase n=1 Tax=Bauldia sp. TaxID=2575872 RepID=UPI001DC34407|nr:FAD:protein FMN transferase [Bauldia sp.]MCB1496775.1 FAD:protein FMN transferase [Bauldia sp.]